jgi:class 3 adenylate cyclase/CHASE2 domain-containing sensor protein
MKLPRVKNLLPDWGRYWNMIPFRTRLVLLGYTLTFLVLIMEAIGALTPLENWLYDVRARHCQFYAKAPTTQLVHLDIDDNALATVGRWPWDRRLIAAVVDEIREAGAKTLALDIQFSDEDTVGTAQQSVFGPTTNPAASTPEQDALEAAARDAALVESIERFGKVVLASDFTFDRGTESELRRVVREQLRADLELTPDELMAWLKKYGGPKLKDADPDRVTEILLVARREVAREKLLAAPTLPTSELLPKETGTGLRTSPLIRLVDNERQKARAVKMMEKLFPREVPSEMPNLMVATGETPPLEPLTRAIWQSRSEGGRGLIGCVTSEKDQIASDGVIRSMPLLINDRGHMLPHFALALACITLNVDPTSREEFRIAPDRIILSPPGGREIEIPVYTFRRGRGYPDVGGMLAIPWFGGSDWATMYNWPPGTSVTRHFPITLATAIVERRNYLRMNEDALRKAGNKISALRDMAGMNPPDPSKPISQVVAETLAAAKDQLDQTRALKPSELDDSLRKLLQAADDLTLAIKSNTAFKAEMEQAKQKLRKAVQGKAVIVGSVASASGASDMFSTSLHSSCPGSAIHGVIFNAIITGNLWSRAPTWISYLLAACFGILMTYSVSKLTPWRATFVAIFLVITFAFINGIWLFDRDNIILNASAPLTATVVVWAGCTAANAGERFRITQLLRGYVDPQLVKYLVDHSEKDLTRAQIKELTVVFTDLHGFTTLSQELGERTAPLISRYMSAMVEVIRRRGGYVNKFLGDGIMFFFGAPEPDANHPEHSVETVLEMHQALEKFNQVIKAEGYPALEMRCGVSTGNMVVGNAGPEDALDYTVLGDAVNLGARLEAANKACNTRVLVTERTYDLTRNKFLYIPVGKLKVRGRSEGSMTYEAVCRIQDATPEQKQLADAMQAMILAFTQGVFDGCLNMVTAIEKKFGENHSCRLYGELCRQYAQEGVPEGFLGEIFFG